MRGSSNLIKCENCKRTIEYLNAKFESLTHKLICIDCNRVPSVHGPSIDPLLNLPIEDFTSPYNIRKSNPKYNFVKQRERQSSKPLSPPLPDLQNITNCVNPLSPLPQTPLHTSPVLRRMSNLSDRIPTEEALHTFGLSNIVPGLQEETQDESIDPDKIANKEFERWGSNYVPSPFSRTKSPQPSTSRGIPGLSMLRLPLPPQHESSDSDIDDPILIKSPTSLRGYLTEFHECDNKNCKSDTHHLAKRKVLKTRAERSSNIRKKAHGF